MLINLRNALMTGKRLPYDAEVEYLQSDGQAFVNTGFVVEDGSKITCNIGMASSYGSTYGYFGASDGTGSYLGGGFNCISPFSDRRLSVWHKNHLYWCTSASSTNVYQDGSLHTMQFEISPTIQSVSFDGTAISYSEGYRSGVNAMPSIPTYLFAVNSAGTAKIAPASAALKIGSFRVEKNGEIKLDVIAVRKGTVGYLYDRVSGKLFGNAGTGDFVLGPDVVPVEWLSRTTNTPYINTLWTPTRPFDVVASIKIQNAAGNKIIMGARNDSSDNGQGIGLFAYASGVRTATGRYGSAASNPAVYALAPFTAGEFFTVKFGVANSKIFYETTSRVELPVSADRGTADWDKAPNPFLLFKFAPTTTRYPITDLYYKSVDIYEESILVRSMKPVRVGQEGAMMDTLTRRIYRNAGTGAFTYGNDLKYPIPA